MALPRVFISTDLLLSSEEKDDAQSLIHALMYQDKMNIVGISGTASKWNHQDGRVGDIDKVLDVYGQDLSNLREHSSAFKSVEALKAVSWQGALDTAPSAGWSNPTDSSRAIITQAKAAAAAGEVLNVLTWGGETDLAQALHEDPSIVSHIRFFNIDTQDNYAYAYIKANFKNDFDMWVDNQTTFRGTYASPNSNSIIKGWHEVNADNHGALGDFFSQLSGDIFNVSGVKMGDSPTVFRFLNGDQNNPSAESWGGEFVKTSTNYWTDNTSDSLDFNRPYYTDGAMTVYEDRAAWTGDFAMRFDWLKDGDSTPAPVPIPTGDNLLVNGSLEASSVPTGSYATFQAVSGWTALTGGRIELWNAHNGVTASNGTDFAELDHASARDGFYQDVRTSAGQAYDLEFDLRTRPSVATATQGVEVVWNGRVIETIRPGVAWDSAEISVTGTGGLDRLTIREVASQSGDGLGALLDNFQLTGAAITPPATSLDTVIVKASGDAYRGDPNFAVFVNGTVVDSTNVVTADNGEGEWDVFTFKGDFDLDGTDTVGIRFTNDRYSAGVGDRNLYVDEITLNGQVNDANLSMPRNAYEYWDF